MELVKCKGMVIFLVIVIGFSLLNSFNMKKYDEQNKESNGTYVAMNIK